MITQGVWGREEGAMLAPEVQGRKRDMFDSTELRLYLYACVYYTIISALIIWPSMEVTYTCTVRTIYGV